MLSANMKGLYRVPHGLIELPMMETYRFAPPTPLPFLTAEAIRSWSVTYSKVPVDELHQWGLHPLPCGIGRHQVRLFLRCYTVKRQEQINVS